MEIKLTEERIKNILVFLNRVEYKGLAEVQAAMDILIALKGNVNGNKQDA